MNLYGQIKFISKEKNLFFATLKKRVDLYFQEKKISKNANAAMRMKTFVLLLVYMLPFFLMLNFRAPFAVNLLLWAIMGIAIAGIGMSVMHDGNHGAYSSSKAGNYFMGHMLNLLGGSTFNWKLQHNILHHTYTNITHIDEDIEDKLMMKFSPHTPVKPYHKLQWVYAFFLYGILSLYWVLAKDFVQFIKYTVNGVNRNSRTQNFIVLGKIIVLKSAYFFVIFFMPMLYFGMPFREALCGFLLMHFIAGLILSVVFQLAHTVEGTSHPQPDSTGAIENDWAIHQMNTTKNFSRENKFISWYVGGLNYQVEHHLFPRICHVHYPGISHIVKQTAEEFNIPYLENKTFAQALYSHIAVLKKLGKLPDINSIAA